MTSEIREQTKTILSVLPEMEERFKKDIHDSFAIGMLDECVERLETLAKEDQGIYNILEGLYALQKYVKIYNR